MVEVKNIAMRAASLIYSSAKKTRAIDHVVTGYYHSTVSESRTNDTFLKYWTFRFRFYLYLVFFQKMKNTSGILILA